jgi:cyclase
MINKRIIPVIIVQNNMVVQSFNFNRYLPIGNPKFIVEYLSSWDCDEIILLDISAYKEERVHNLSFISELSKNISVPLTVGGGIRGLKEAEMYFKNGADKICVNSLFTDNKYDSINDISSEYGAQSTVLSLDFTFDKTLGHSLYDYKNKINLNISVLSTIEKIKNSLEVGELFVNSVDRDGSKLGYDLNLLNTISKEINKPILALGGANTLEHFKSLLDINNITGICASNVFLHFEHSVEYFRSLIKQKNKTFRPNNYFSYE